MIWLSQRVITCLGYMEKGWNCNFITINSAYPQISHNVIMKKIVLYDYKVELKW